MTHGVKRKLVRHTTLEWINIMKHQGKAKLEIYGDVDALSRIKDIAIAMSEHGMTGHGFSVTATDGKHIEKTFGYWDGHGASSMNRVKLTETKTGEFRDSVLCRSIEPDEENDSYFFSWNENKDAN